VDEKYLYQLYGMTIAVPFECPELLGSEGPPSVVVELGPTPARLGETWAEAPYFQANARELLLWIDGLGRFHAVDGRAITIERQNGGSEIDLRAFLLGPVFAAILHQRGVLPLHASAIERDGGAVLFVGPSGSGKSTLAAAFAQRGHRILADDVAAVVLQEGRPLVLPGYPQLKLWSDGLTRIGAATEGLPRVESRREKYGLAMLEQHCGSPLPLESAYVLQPSGDAAGVELEELRGMHKLTPLLANTYRTSFLGEADGKIPNFEQCADVARAARVVRVARPASGDTVEALAGRIEEDLQRRAA
jgi:hypothetical protein